MKTYNIPVFVPHLGCLFDCVFCNQRKITGVENQVCEADVARIIEQHIQSLPKENCSIEIAFFGGSFTGIEIDLQERLLTCASSYIGKSNITGIRVSTRPDYIDHAVLERLLKFGVTTIELGVQSMDDGVLAASCRGHKKEAVINAVSQVRRYPFRLGLQMMTGLPGDTKEKSLATAKEIIRLRPDFVRIYPTLIIRDTALEDMYKKGLYQPQTLEEAVELCYELYKLFQQADIAIIRIGLQHTDEISVDGAVVAGPLHSAFGELVESRMYFERISQLIKDRTERELIIEVNPREVSKAVGHKQSNIIRIEQEWNKKIRVRAEESVKKGEVKIASK